MDMRIYNSYININIMENERNIILVIIITYLILRNKVIYNIIYNIFNEALPKKSYMSMIITIFTFILISNIVGLIPYSYAITSKIRNTISISLTIIIGITIIGLVKNKISFFKRFIPKDVPGVLKPIMFIIEIISYLSRILSLSIRLSANITSGHLILSIISTFGGSYILLIPIILLEIGVTVIQAYVFTLLIIYYIKEI